MRALERSPSLIERGDFFVVRTYPGPAKRFVKSGYRLLYLGLFKPNLPCGGGSEVNKRDFGVGSWLCKNVEINDEKDGRDAWPFACENPLALRRRLVVDGEPAADSDTGQWPDQSMCGERPGTEAP